MTRQKMKGLKGQITWIDFELLEQGELESEAKETVLGRVLVNLCVGSAASGLSGPSTAQE